MTKQTKETDLMPSNSSDVPPVELVTDAEVRQLFADEAETNPILAAQLEHDLVNPIQLAKVLDMRPQMVYQYIQNGRILSRQHNSTQKIVVPLDEAVRYAKSVLTKRAEKQMKIERELRGE